MRDEVQTTWHFDAVIADIDKMIVALREEEKADIAHRDWSRSLQGVFRSSEECSRCFCAHGGMLSMFCCVLRRVQGVSLTDIEHHDWSRTFTYTLAA